MLTGEDEIASRLGLVHFLLDPHFVAPSDLVARPRDNDGEQALGLCGLYSWLKCNLREWIRWVGLRVVGGLQVE